MNERNSGEEPRLGKFASMIAGAIVLTVSLACGAGIGCLLALPALLTSSTAYAVCAVVVGAAVSGYFIVELPISAASRMKKFGLEGLLEDNDKIVATKHYIKEALASAPFAQKSNTFARSLGHTIEAFSTRLHELGVGQQDMRTRISILGHLIKRSAKSRAFIDMWWREGTLLAALRLKYTSTFAAVEPDGLSILDALDSVEQTVLAASVSSSHHVE